MLALRERKQDAVMSRTSANRTISMTSLHDPLESSFNLFDSTDSDDIALEKMIELQKLIKKANKRT